MRLIKRSLVFLLLLSLSLVLFRGWIYRSLVTYESVGERKGYSVSDERLVALIEAGAKELEAPEVREVIELGLTITGKQLHFTAEKNHNDPNLLLNSRSAHCVGYAHFFASTCNYLLSRYGLSKDWTARPQLGQLYLMGSNVHQYLSSPFFKDHDFVVIENRRTGEIFAVDPTLSDYLMIDHISFRAD